MSAAGDKKLSEAVAAHQLGNMADAERLYRTLLNEDPTHADACALLGVVVGARGNVEEAVKWVDKAVKLDPDAAILHFHRGTVLMAAQQLDEAIISLKYAVGLLPNVAQIHFNLANGLRAAGDWKAAIDHYREALKLEPTFTVTYNNLALSLVHEEQYEEALSLAQQAVTRDPNYGDGWLTLSNVAEKLKKYEFALDAAKRATILLPNNHYSWFGYGLVLNRLNRDLEAMDAYKRALELNPKGADIWDNLAQTYQSLNWLEKAEETFRGAIDVAGQTIQNEQGREVEESEYGNRHWHLALIELLRGKYKEGFARYRSRVNSIRELKRLPFPFPLWKGEDLKGKSLLVCDEQGYGDTLMLARFLPHLRATGVKIVFSVHKVLVPFLRDWQGIDLVIAHNDKVPLCDYFCSSFDLPHRLGTTLENLPHKTPYLPQIPVDEKLILPKNASPKIGVVWGGSPLHLNDNKRSVPLRIFSDLFSLSHLKFYSFNRDLKPGDAEMLSHTKIENLVPHLTDFAAAAQLLSQMNMLITCDTAMAHLAAGLGKKTWVMLPFAPDWRWLTDRKDSPWYPEITLFRQPKSGDWVSVIDEIKEELKKSFPA